jgi:hypothetical protein
MHKYGDAVQYVRHTPDGDQVINAIVLASSLHIPLRGDRQFHTELDGDGKTVLDPATNRPKLLEPEEHLDLAFPVATETGLSPKSRSMDEIFRPANDVRQDSGFGGWREVASSVIAEVDRIAGSPLATTEDPEMRARVLYEKSCEIDRLTQQLKDANNKIAAFGTPGPEPVTEEKQPVVLASGPVGGLQPTDAAEGYATGPIQPVAFEQPVSTEPIAE